MKTIKITVKREQIKEAIDAPYGFIYRDSYGNHKGCPDEITLELPAEQIDLGPVWPKPTPSTCAHNFEEIELGGLGKIKRCRHCGTAREVKQEKKRRQFRVTEIHCRGRFGEYLKAGDLLLLEEVE